MLRGPQHLDACPGRVEGAPPQPPQDPGEVARHHQPRWAFVLFQLFFFQTLFIFLTFFCIPFF